MDVLTAEMAQEVATDVLADQAAKALEAHADSFLNANLEAQKKKSNKCATCGDFTVDSDKRNGL